MFGSMNKGANAYAKVGIETGVVAASPHGLITMLFDGAIIAIGTGLQEMKAGNVAAKGKAISKAITIIDSGLRASLDKNAGGEIAANLDGLYEYLSARLLTANLKNQPEILEEVLTLLKDLKGAWDAIGSTPGSAPQPQAPAQPAAYDPLAPQMSRLVKA